MEGYICVYLGGLLFGERVNVSKIKFFKEYFTDTWHRILHDVEEYFVVYPRMKNKNG